MKAENVKELLEIRKIILGIIPQTMYDGFERDDVIKRLDCIIISELCED